MTQIDSMDIFWRLDDFLDSAILFYAGVGYRGPLEFRLTLDFITGKGVKRASSGRQSFRRTIYVH